MTWSDLPKPDGVGDVSDTDDGFRASVSIPTDDDGFFGRECPACEAPFKMDGDQYEMLPDDLELTCPYCGHRGDPDSFITKAQLARLEAVAAGLAEQWMHRELGSMLGRTFGPSAATRPERSGFALSMRYEPGSPPRVADLPDAVEAQTRRLVDCSTCRSRYAVFSVTPYCPVCGPRPAVENVLEEIAAARGTFAIEDSLPEDQRESLRAIGVFERFSVDAVGSVVELFEVFARDQFERRVPNASEHMGGKGNVFQRLDDAAKLVRTHAGIDLVALATPDRWNRLKRAFARRHVLTHKAGIVDARFLRQVPESGLQVGQRIIVSRQEAETALDDLEAFVRSVAAH